MKVIFIAREYPPYVYGGAGVHLRELARCLAKLMPVEVRCFGDQDIRSPELRVKGYRPTSSFHCESQPKFNSLFNTLGTNLNMLCDGMRGDVVHTHTWYAHWAGLLAKMLYGVPFVATCHSLEPLRPWKEEQLAQAFQVSSWMEKVSIEGADRVVAVSNLMKKDIVDHFRVDPERVVVIHNGVDLDTWKPTPITSELKRRLGIADDYVLFVGRPTPQKGMEHLLDAADRIPVQVVMGAAGADTKEYEERMKEKVKGRKNVVWINRLLEEKEYIQLYTSARVFICPSIYEPFGIINLEAMACETPVVASRVGGILEVVVPGETGILVDPGRPEEIASAVNSLLENPDLAREMGKKGRRRAVEYFSWDSIARKTRELYLSLLSA